VVVTEPTLPDRAAEDRDESWGDRADDDDEERLQRERPPHHDRED
jgi:hypothetical protein